MAQHYEVKAGETLAIQGPANIIVKTGVIPMVGEPGPAPGLMSISPDTAVVGDPDLTMTATGNNFTASSVINFNGGDEPTTFVSATELTTVVKPSTASVPIAVPVLIKTGPQASSSVNFTFTDAAMRGRKR